MAKKHTDDSLGIAPVVAAAAAPVVSKGAEMLDKAANRREARRVRHEEYERTHKVTPKKVIVGTLLTGLIAFAGVKTCQAIRRSNLKKKALSDAEVGSAVKIWESVPDSFKSEWTAFSVLNPFASVTGAITSIKRLWEDVNTQMLYDAGKYMHDNGLNINKVARHFKILYKIDLVDFLNEVLTTDQYVMFNNCVNTGEQTSTPTPEGKNESGEILYCVTASPCNIRKSPECTFTLSVSGKIPTNPVSGVWQVPAHTIVGQWTGKSETYQSKWYAMDDDCNFALMNALLYDGSKMVAVSNINHYVAKSQLYNEGLTKSDLKARFGSAMKVLVYNPTSKKYVLNNVNLDK